MPMFFSSIAQRTLICVVALWSLHGAFITSARINFLDVDLNNEVKSPSCALGSEHSRKARSGDSPSATDDDCLAYIETCPEKLKISWLHVPPFIYASSNNETRPTIQLRGVFHDILIRAIGVCCKYFAGTVPKIEPLKKANNLDDLHQQIITGTADMIAPVYSDGVTYGGMLPYVKILDSPGVVLIQRRQGSALDRLRSSWQALLNTWPVVIIAFSMSLLAGLSIWMMETWINSKEFPRQFHHGTFEGFWWAVVTMSTVGYGDKTPKSIQGKLFAVLWILIGISICCVMTASISSALTTSRIENYDVTSGKKIGVVRDSIALQDAVNLAASIENYNNTDELYDSLLNGTQIDGFMEELFTGIELLKMKDKLKYLAVAKFIQHSRGHGVAYREHVFRPLTAACVLNITKFRSSDVIALTSQYLKASREDRHVPANPGDEYSEDANIFGSKLPLFKGIIIASSVVGSLVFSFGAAYLVASKCSRTGERDSHKQNIDTNDSWDERTKCASLCRIQTEV